MAMVDCGVTPQAVPSEELASSEWWKPRHGRKLRCNLTLSLHHYIGSSPTLSTEHTTPWDNYLPLWSSNTFDDFDEGFWISWGLAVGSHHARLSFNQDRNFLRADMLNIVKTPK